MTTVTESVIHPQRASTGVARAASRAARLRAEVGRTLQSQPASRGDGAESAPRHVHPQSTGTFPRTLIGDE